MAEAPVSVSYGSPSTTSSAVDVIERASPNITTTTTADPGSAGTTLAVTSNALFPQSGTFKVAVGTGTATPEIMYVSAGAGTNSWTVQRGKDGSTGVAHAIGQTVALVVGVQRVESVTASKQVTYLGRAATFATLGRAGTTGQKIFAIHNAGGSPVLVDVDKISVDVMQTAAKVVEPPKMRAWKFTAVPTNGSAITKVPEDSSLTSSASVTLWQDSSSDNTGSTTTLTITLPAATVLVEEWAARALTLVGYEQFDKAFFFEAENEVVTLLPLEGLAIFLDYTVSTANPVTDKWLVSCRWVEYTLA